MAVKVKFLLSLTLLVSLLSGGLQAQVLKKGNPEDLGFNVEKLNRIESVIKQAMEDKEIPGAVVLVARKGKVVYRKVFGTRSLQPQREALTFDTVFDMASVTKVMATACSIMILVEEGKISLNDPLSKYIPEFGNRGKRNITILQMLTHYSGLRPDLDLDFEWKGYEKAIELACRERLESRPGEEFIYSDINFFMLGELVRVVTGKTLDQFAKERIFEPLSLKDTGYLPDPSLVPRIAPTEKRDGEMLRGEVHDPTTFRMGGVAGHAGLFSTAEDTLAWAQMILQGGIYGGTRILSPMSVLKMTTPQTPYGKGDWRGLGFDIETMFSTNRGDLFPVGSFGHTGFTGTSVWIDPFSETVLVLFSSRLYATSEGTAVFLRRKVASIVAASIEDMPLNRDHYYYRY
ncbi:MAG: serine hydrolase domain-containing protein [Acidobacteriota bacterium]